MPRIVSVLLTGVIFLATAPGCGTNAGCLDYAQTVCARQMECSAFLAKYDGANLGACQTMLLRSCELSTKAPDSNFSQEAASACAQRLAQASCEVILSGPRPSECRPPGLRPLAASCADGFQCQSLFCARSALECGTCQPLPKAGEVCTTYGVCDTGLLCSGQGTCAPPRGVGEVCDADFGCQTTLACSEGICQVPTLGQSCAGRADTCNADALQVCEPGTQTCQLANYSVASVGESCGVDLLHGIYIDCPIDAYCQTMGSPSFGICTLLPKEGEACALVGGSGVVYGLCLPPFSCIAGSCQIFDRASCK